MLYGLALASWRKSVVVSAPVVAIAPARAQVTSAAVTMNNSAGAEGAAHRAQLAAAVRAACCSSGMLFATEVASSSPCGKVDRVASHTRVIAAQVVCVNAVATGRAQQVAAPMLSFVTKTPPPLVAHTTLPLTDHASAPPLSAPRTVLPLPTHASVPLV
jgi:hypothetical protein